MYIDDEHRRARARKAGFGLRMFHLAAFGTLLLLGLLWVLGYEFSICWFLLIVVLILGSLFGAGVYAAVLVRNED
jgi:hypothetical protein